MWCWSRRSKIVPFFAGTLKVRLSVAVMPSELPLMRYRRLGYVWPRHEPKYRSPTGNTDASEYVNGRSMSSQNHIATGPLAFTKPSLLPPTYDRWLAFQSWRGTSASWHTDGAC